ncbi:MAG: hypothetical protein LBD08_00230 [Treponema sp.]|jgi:hypothetical protein|nr:hypothetical protein [Treponema sp.]
MERLILPSIASFISIARRLFLCISTVIVHCRRKLLKATPLLTAVSFKSFGIIFALTADGPGSAAP